MKISFKRGDTEVILEPQTPAEYAKAECLLHSLLGQPSAKPARAQRANSGDSELNRARAEAIEALLAKTNQPRSAIEIAEAVKRTAANLFTTANGDPIHLVRRALADDRFTKALTGGFVLASRAEEFRPKPSATADASMIDEVIRVFGAPAMKEDDDESLDDPFADE